MGELKNKQKQQGRYVGSGSSSEKSLENEDIGNAVGSEASAQPPRPTSSDPPPRPVSMRPPVPRRPRLDPKESSHSRTSEHSAGSGRASAGNDLQAALERRRRKSDTPVEENASVAAAAPVIPTHPEPATASVSSSKPTLTKKTSSSSQMAAKFREQRAKRLAGNTPVIEKEPAPIVAHHVEASRISTVKRRDLEPKKDPFEEWDTYYADGEPYYVNRKTGETTWDKPTALQSAAENEALSGEFVWVKHEDLAWVPAKVLERTDRGLVVAERPQAVDHAKTIIEERRHVKQADVGPEIISTQTLTSLTSDLVQLDQVHEPGIIDLLRRRYAVDKIYTNVGDILIAINPFKATSLFSPSVMHEYAETGRESMELPPHPYAVINGAYRTMIDELTDQSLLISGESGAGKTVTVKVCLEFLSEIAGSDNNIEQKILASNPILESFGNAKTVRNDNSSRFGKFMEIHFDTSGSRKIMGCHTLNYLLEKSRVVDQAPGERNFHIFHYLVRNFDPSLREKYLVNNTKPSSFNYLPDEEVLSEHHDDADECSKMHHALEEMGFSEVEQDGMFRIVAGILHLGNLSFEDFESTGSRVTTDCKAHLDAFCKLLGTDAKQISDALTMHISQQRDGILKRAFSTKVASDARNALARHLYNRLFEWIISRINKALVVEGSITARGRSNRNLLPGDGKASSNFIGMLDIFGFEIFEINSFEQLSINFANEKLQQMFNRHTFTLEEQTYINEGVPFDKIEFHDSQPLLTFLGLQATGNPIVRDGVFQLLDEQTTINGTDEKFLQTIASRHNDKRKLFSDRCKSRTAFKVFHYAGAVEYETGGFVYKNADKLYENIEAAMSESSLDIITTIFGGGSQPAQTSVRSRKQTKTQASTFMKQLSQLEERTNSTFPRYIRCVKPNPYKKPGIFVSPMCLQQLRFAGVFEAVSIRKKGYPFRKSHANFFVTYRCVEPSAVSKRDWMDARKTGNYRKCAENLLNAMIGRSVPSAKDCRMGKTMILYRADQHRALEIQRLGVLNRAAAEIQKCVRGMYVRNHVPELVQIRGVLTKAIASRKVSELDTALGKSKPLFFKIKEAYDAEAVKEAIRLEESLEPKIAKLRTLSEAPNACFDDSVFTQLDSICSEMKKYMKRDKMAFRANKSATLLLDRHTSFLAQREILEQLGSVLQHVGERPAMESLEKLDELNERTEKLQQPFAEKLKTASEEAIAVFRSLSSEVKLIQACSSAYQACSVSQGAEILDISATCANVGSLHTAKAALDQHKVLSSDGQDAEKRATWAKALCDALILAMQNAQHADDPEWIQVETLLGEGQGFSVMDNLLFPIDGEQLSLIGRELAMRAQVDQIVRKIEESVIAVDDEPLAVALEQAHTLNLLNHHDSEIRNIVAQGDALLPKIRDTRARLQSAVQQVDEVMLYEALCAQADCGYGAQAGMVGYELVNQATILYGWVQNLTREARIAVDALELEPTQVIVAGCDEIGLQLEELPPLRDFLALPRERQLIRQRDAALALQNYRRALALSIAHKDLLFANLANSDNFALEHFPRLKTPEEFAKRFGFTFSKYKGNMLHWYNPTFGKIHTSLTTIEPTTSQNGKPLHKTATLLFKNVFGVMGDKIYENVDSLAQELLATGLQIPDLVDEIYCQVMKQVTENPKQESANRGWNLMSMLLATFPPSSQLEMYLEYFLRKQGRQSCVKTLHQVLICGPLTTAPSITDIQRERQPTNTDAWFDGLRTQITVGKDVFQGQVQPDQLICNWRNGEEGYQTGPPPQQQGGAPPAPPPHATPAPPPHAAPAPMATPEYHDPYQSRAAAYSKAPPPPPPAPGHGVGEAPPPVPGHGMAAPPPPKKVGSAAPMPPPKRSSAAPAQGYGLPPPPPPKKSGHAPAPPPHSASPYADEEDDDDII
eukprot:CAMPEP_0203755414 /NCGR_PEP_ID=MMETSP0098-20131031/8869_1 /ASSEMBLY_ACC=CAM_ASM_000208 /TAXON_ID=96639 /ORGANISM=" , Strain NY0313808BC1" /LENGTH=1902 /DNA_ID=CAMNT_0050646867 /DNA_START=366 /DNA_END=6074 /DNA_ORIENTATION=-